MKPLVQWCRRAALAMLVACVGLGLLTARAVEKGEAAVQESDRAFDQGKVHEAAHYARRAAVYYAPGAPHLRAAYERLRAVAAGAEAAGDRETARFAWNAMRSAVLETRHVRVPFPDELAAANRALARLEVRETEPVSRRERLLQIKVAERDLSQGSGTRSGWIVLLALGFAGTVAGLAGFTLTGVQHTGRLRSRAVRISGFVTLLGAVCWAWAVVSA
ncbi:MAG TPA: hypothetical protein VFU02_17340 [Polyangiaceae bacterium]|nr:hypothetical protein [Polyangiaceae bacterium]